MDEQDKEEIKMGTFTTRQELIQEKRDQFINENRDQIFTDLMNDIKRGTPAVLTLVKEILKDTLEDSDYDNYITKTNHWKEIEF